MYCVQEWLVCWIYLLPAVIQLLPSILYCIKMTQGFANNGDLVRARLKTGENVCLGANAPTGLGSYRGTGEDEL